MDLNFHFLLFRSTPNKILRFISLIDLNLTDPYLFSPTKEGEETKEEDKKEKRGFL